MVDYATIDPGVPPYGLSRNPEGKHRCFLVVFLIVITGFTAYGQSAWSFTPPAETGDGWHTSDLRHQGSDTTRMYQLFRQMHSGANQVHSVLVAHRGQLVIEEYFNGHSRHEPHDLRSVTKSIRSLLLGIALDKGFIDRVDDPISKYLEPTGPAKNPDIRKDSITIEYLLTMSAGWDCNDWDPRSDGQEDRVYKKKDWIQYTLDLPLVNPPGAVANYCSMGAVLVAEIIGKASGMPIHQFADKYLFQPLGCKQVAWGHTSDKNVIPSGKRLYMTPRDMAKIGQLVLDGGRWDGRQIVPSAWIRESTSPKTQITGIAYGYFWWELPLTANGKTFRTIAATGNGGQYILVIPDLELVTVFTGGAYNSQEDKLPFAIVQDVFIPTFSKK